MYDLIFMIVDYYMKMIHYLFMKKTLTVVKLTKLFFEQIALRYEILNNQQWNSSVRDADYKSTV